MISASIHPLRLTFLLVTILVVTSCRANNDAKIAENSTVLVHGGKNNLTFAQFTDSQNHTLTGIMLNPNTMIALNDEKLKNGSNLNVSFSKNNISNVIANHFLGVNEFGSGSESGLEHKPATFHVYKTNKSIDGVKDLKISQVELTGTSDQFTYIFADANENIQFNVTVGFRNNRLWVIELPKGQKIKAGGAVLDSTGNLFGFINNFAEEIEWNCGARTYGQVYMLKGQDKTIEKAKAGFPTKKERDFSESFDRLHRNFVLFSSNVNNAEIIKLMGAELSTPDEKEPSGKLNIKTKNCNIFFETYAHLTLEDLKSKELAFESVYFANKDRPKMNLSEIKTLDKVTKCLRDSISWYLPEKFWWNQDIRPFIQRIKDFASTLDQYAKEQEAGITQPPTIQ